MENIKMEDIIEAPTSEAPVEETTQEQDPLKIELERVQKKDGRTELEKAAFTLKKNAERIKELGGDPTSILGVEKHIENEDDVHLTVGMWKKMQQENASQTALQLAEDIANEAERELTKYHLHNSIKSTGNPSEDLNLARAIVNASRNSQIIEEVSRKVPAKTHSSSSGAPANHKESFEPTADEKIFMRQFGLTEEEILAARIKSSKKNNL